MQKDKFSTLNKLVGNTPLIKITYEYNKHVKDAYFKLEWYNLTGSIKDRMALYILKKAYQQNKLKKGQTIVESTSGNTGISFSAMGKFLGNPVTILMPKSMSEERKQLISGYGATLKLVNNKKGFLHCLKLAKKIAKKQNAFLPLQFENKYNTQVHFLTTGQEIINQLKLNNKIPTALVAGVGTGGTLMGVAKRLKQANKNLKIFAVEPASYPTIKLGKKVGTHLIQGISDDFVPPLLNKECLTDIIDIHDKDAILMAQKLSKELGLGVGVSSGANFLASVIVNNKSNLEEIVVSVFSDDNKKYLSSSLNLNIKASSNYLNSKIKLLNYSIV